MAPGDITSACFSFTDNTLTWQQELYVHPQREPPLCGGMERSSETSRRRRRRRKGFPALFKGWWPDIPSSFLRSTHFFPPHCQEEKKPQKTCGKFLRFLLFLETLVVCPACALVLISFYSALTCHVYFQTLSDYFKGIAGKDLLKVFIVWLMDDFITHVANTWGESYSPLNMYASEMTLDANMSVNLLKK